MVHSDDSPPNPFRPSSFADARLAGKP